ncbi:MAG: nickel pincer cofactor biosynthesis protein LarB [Methanocellales archaeon]
MSLRKILERLKKHEVSVGEAEKQIKLLSFKKLEKIAKLDIHREKRTGIPEAILAEGKSIKALIKIAKAQLQSEGKAIITRLSEAQLEPLRKICRRGVKLEWYENARIAILRKGKKPERSGGKVGIVTAGTADIAAAEEAKVIAEEMGCEVLEIRDVGVAGIHRLFPELSKLVEFGADAVVVAAGREGTLPAIVAGLLDVPVIGLPVSTGYGKGGSGEAALLAMLQSCSALAVVNIDAGFVAGGVAARIANKAAEGRK